MILDNFCSHLPVVWRPNLHISSVCILQHNILTHKFVLRVWVMVHQKSIRGVSGWFHGMNEQQHIWFDDPGSEFPAYNLVYLAKYLVWFALQIAVPIDGRRHESTCSGQPALTNRACAVQSPATITSVSHPARHCPSASGFSWFINTPSNRLVATSMRSGCHTLFSTSPGS